MRNILFRLADLAPFVIMGNLTRERPHFLGNCNPVLAKAQHP
ncbi:MULTISPECIES: hypothetical protein [unclassified Aliiroseovarius]|nr:MULTISPECIES: hypothetical protein [unclassified Aliiroseovarius]